MARITVDLSELADLPARFDELRGYRAYRTRQEMAAQALEQHQDRFDRRVSPTGAPWPPRRDNKPHPLLEETGKMRRSLRAVPAGRRDTRIDVKATRRVGSVDVAAVHQHGSGRVPQRQFLGFGDGDLVELAETAADGLERWFGDRL